MGEKIKSAIKKAEEKILQKIENRQPDAPHKLSLIFVIAPRNKSDFFTDFLHEYEINAEYVLSASGTASNETLSALGVVSSDKAVIIGVVRNDMIKPALSGLEEKFRTLRGAKGVAFVSPMTSLIGVAVYQFLCNKEK